MGPEIPPVHTYENKYFIIIGIWWYYKIKNLDFFGRDFFVFKGSFDFAQDDDDRNYYFNNKPTINSATIFATLIIGLIDGPAVSLYGSPTVSPVTAA